MTDYPGALWVPAHPTNFYAKPCTPKGWVLHTPEEDADHQPSTPYYFQTPNISASTHYFVAYDGRIFQMVEERYTPIANGVLGKPYPAWADPSYTLNGQTLSVEIEGRAASIHWTLVVGSLQWISLVRLITARGNFPKDRAHVIGHYQVSTDRSDPGAHFPWDALMRDLQPEEDEMFTRYPPSLADTGVAKWPTGQTLAALPTDYEQQLAVDFPKLPANAKAIDLEVIIDNGELIYKDGDGRYAGTFDSYHRTGVVRVIPKDRKVRIAVTKAVKVVSVRCVGYLS